MRLLWSLLTLSALLTPTWAAEITYIGPINTLTSWNNAVTWSGGQIPGANDDVIIPASAKLSFSTNDPITISSLTMASGSSLYFNTSDPFGPSSPVITVKSFTLGNAANNEAVTIDGVALSVTSTFSVASARTLSFINFASLSVSSTATTTLSASTMSFSIDSSGIFDGTVTVNGDVNVNGVVRFNGAVSVTQGATLTVVGSYGIFSGAVTLSSQSTLLLRSLCTFEASATITGDATSRINIDGTTSYLGPITISIPINIIAGTTTFTAQATLSNVDVNDNAILAINNNATITTLVLHNNSTIGTFAIVQSRAGVVVDTLTSADNNINIRGVNLVTRVVSMTSSQPIDVSMLTHATWTWLNTITSNTEVTVSTSDNTTPRIIHIGAATIPTLNIRVCYTNTSSATYNGASAATLTLQTPSSMICTSNTTDIIDLIPTSSPTSSPTSTPTTPSPTGQPIQGTNSSTGGIGIIPTNDGNHVYSSIWIKFTCIIVLMGMIV